MFYVCPDQISIVCFFLKKLVDRPYYIVLPLKFNKRQCPVWYNNKASE